VLIQLADQPCTKSPEVVKSFTLSRIEAADINGVDRTRWPVQTAPRRTISHPERDADSNERAVAHWPGAVENPDALGEGAHCNPLARPQQGGKAGFVAGLRWKRNGEEGLGKGMMSG